ncbi:MAG: hypothetical protein ACK5AL_18150 [Planctomycetota bacterium]
MAPYALLPNVLAFCVGQVAAWHYLRTGRAWVGGLATLGLWLLLDAWLLARYVYVADAGTLRLLAGSLQVLAVGTTLRLLQQLWRRRRSAAARRRTDRHREAIGAYLRGDWRLAVAGYRALVRTDPWDAAAWIGLGDAIARTGNRKAAARCYWRAQGVDVGKAHADLLQLRRARRATAG